MLLINVFLICSSSNTSQNYINCTYTVLSCFASYKCFFNLQFFKFITACENIASSLRISCDVNTQAYFHPTNGIMVLRLNYSTFKFYFQEQTTRDLRQLLKKPNINYNRAIMIHVTKK